MSFDWSQYLNLARELVGTSQKASNQEAKERAAISRAYYAAFKTARNYLKNNRGYYPPKGTNTHHDVIAQFMKGSEDDIEIAGFLSDLFDIRKKADYDDLFPEMNANMIKFAFIMADSVITTLQTLKP